MAEKKSISPKWQKAIACLLQGLSVRDTAKRIGVGERTLARWKTDPEFRAAYDQARQQVFDETVAQLAEMTTMAVGRLRDILSGRVQGDHATLRAIEICLREARATEEAQIRQAIYELTQQVERLNR